MNMSWYECEIITQIHHLGWRGLSVATIYGQRKIADTSYNQSLYETHIVSHI